ncbi:aldo/keto reductase [Azospirillum brasilense]|nr:aldo/keto reductase [Azospirillum brasilense]
MRYRPLGRTGLTVSEIGFGTWGLGGDSYGPADDDVSRAALRAAFDRGITFYDTSDLYGAGHSETVLGAALEDVRARIVIGTKVGLLPHTGFAMPQDFSVAHLREGLEASLDRLRTRYVDLYLLHSPELGLLRDDPEIIATLKEFQAQGKIRAWGLSARSPADAKAGVEEFDFPAVQVNYNMIDQRAQDDGLFALARARGTGIIARTPLCFGYLTGKLAGDHRFTGRDHRANWPADQLSRWAEAPGLFAHLYDAAGQRTATQLALQFCLADDAVSTVIPGMMTAAEVDENVMAAERPPLTAEELTDIRSIYASNTFYDRSAKQRGKQQ